MINPPYNLAGSFVAKLPGRVRLTWEDSNPGKDLDHFLLYRQDLTQPGAATAVEVTKKKYDDYDITLGHTYRYWVTAVAKWGEESGPSDAVDVATQSDEPPAPPQGVVAAVLDPGVSFDWQPNGEPNLGGYNVYISKKGKWKRLNGVLLADNHHYYASGVLADTYAVSAVNVFGVESAYAVVQPQPTTPVLHEENDPAVTVEGMWAIERYAGASGGAIRVSPDAGAKLHFAFTGRQVKLLAANYWTCGLARVYVDGQLMATVDMYSPSSVFMVVAISVPGLKYGTHLLTVEVLGEGNPEPESDYDFVNVDAFEVR